MKLNEIKQAGICALKYMDSVTDNKDHTFVVLTCEGCNWKSTCLEIQRVVERCLNRYAIKV